MSLTEEWAGPKWDGMPKPPSLKERIAALRKDEEVMEFLRTLRVTEYHWIAEKETGEPLTGGHVESFDLAKSDCEWLLTATIGASPSSPLHGIRSVRITDALGVVVWSKEKEVDDTTISVTTVPPTDG